MMRVICKLAVVCAAILLVSANPARGQSKPEYLFNPPEWILGEWANIGGADADKIERIVFSSHEIELIQGVADTPVQFSRKFKKYQVKETTEPEIYRVVISKDKDEFVYEFKLCPKDECRVTANDALTYAITKNKKTISTHSTSINVVLIKRKTNSSKQFLAPRPNNSWVVRSSNPAGESRRLIASKAGARQD